MEGAAPFKQIINDAVAILFNLIGHISDLSCVLNTVQCTLYCTIQLLFPCSTKEILKSACVAQRLELLVTSSQKCGWVKIPNILEKTLLGNKNQSWKKIERKECKIFKKEKCQTG